MQWILSRLIQYKNFFLFIFLLGIGLVFSSYRSYYHQSSLQQFGIIITGNISQSINKSKSYLNLRESNQKLLKENNKLQEKILYLKGLRNSSDEDEINPELIQYFLKSAQVVKNSFSKARNILIINKGSSDGIKKDMSVVSSDGIVGIIKQTSNDFSSIISVLYQDFKINAKLNNSGAFGSLSWKGRSPNKMILSDVSVINAIELGDTIVTGGMSAYFPKGIPIGIIVDFDIPIGGYYSIEVELLNNLTNLENVYIIDNKKRSEFLDLQIKDNNDSR
tara:strand:- start:162 stop:992 length:831 start_codon:yes stop_codon:yes gene_type:complete